MKKTLSFLIADDDPDDRELFCDILREQLPGITLRSVADGTEVVAFLKHCPAQELPDALIMDYNMTLMSAPQVLEQIARNPEYQGLSTFIVSTSAEKRYIDGCMDKGVIEYFKKPSDVEAIRKVASRIIRLVTHVSEKS